MKDIIVVIIKNVLTALYQPFWFAVLLSVMVMFFTMYVKEHGLKQSFKNWMLQFKASVKFRRGLVLVFYVTMILYRTLLNRSMWLNPLSNVLGVWGLHDADGKLTTEIPENIALMIPFIFLLLWTFSDRLVKDFKLYKIAWQSVKITFIFSFIIEFLQLFLRLGTFQISDLVFNTIGGLIGGIIYWIVFKIVNISNKKSSD